MTVVHVQYMYAVVNNKPDLTFRSWLDVKPSVFHTFDDALAYYNKVKHSNSCIIKFQII